MHVEPAVVQGTDNPTIAEPAVRVPVPVDTHVHVYPWFDQQRLLAAATRRFRAAAAANGGDIGRPAGSPTGVLCLSETARDNVFELWAQASAVDDWAVVLGDEPFVLRLVRDDGAVVVVLAGRQVITAERLEVLALGVRDTFTDGLPIEETLAAVRGKGALAVLPYGVGKWSGARGRLMAQLIERHAGEPTAFALGDNSGRIMFGPRPPVFDQAAARGVTLLPGSDPLPMPGTERHAGRYGLLIDLPADPATPRLGATVIRKLSEVGPVPRRYGSPLLPPAALFQQVMLRLNRRKGNATPTPAAGRPPHAPPGTPSP